MMLRHVQNLTIHLNQWPRARLGISLCQRRLQHVHFLRLKQLELRYGITSDTRRKSDPNLLTQPTYANFTSKTPPKTENLEQSQLDQL